MYPDPDLHSPPSEPIHGKHIEFLKIPGRIWRPTSRILLWLVRLSVVTILTIIVLFGLEFFKQAREAQLRTYSKKNLKIIGLATHNHADQHSGLPPHTTTDASGRPLHGWQTHLLPFMDEAPLHARIDFSKAWDHPDNAPHFKHDIPNYNTPPYDQPAFSPRGFVLSGYAANSQLLKQNVFVPMKDITDGASNTIMTGEILDSRPPWGKPGNVRDPALGIHCGPTCFGGRFEGATAFGFADGSVRFISNDIDPDVLKALATPAAKDGWGQDGKF